MREFLGSGPNEDELYSRETEPVWADDDPLVQRLRAMKWAEVSSEVRERCWGEIRQRIDELDRQGVLPTTPQHEEVNCERYAFSRRSASCRISAGGIFSRGLAQTLRSQPLAFAGR